MRKRAGVPVRPDDVALARLSQSRLHVASLYQRSYARLHELLMNGWRMAYERAIGDHGPGTCRLVDTCVPPRVFF